MLRYSNPDAVTKIVNALNIRVSPRDLKSKDTRNLLTLVMQQWLPLSTATFQAVVDVISRSSSSSSDPNTIYDSSGTSECLINAAGTDK